MVSAIDPQDGDVVIRFGGGIHSSAPEYEIKEREAADGRNFLLDVQNTELQNRPPFDLVATAANAGSIRGGGNLVKSDGTVSAFFQAGDTVYEWDGDALLSSTLDTVNASAQLRSSWNSAQWPLDDKCIITDLSLLEPVKEWDGTTWQDVTFTDESGGSFGNFYAKYCYVDKDRVVFANVKEATALPHLVVGTEVEDYTVITIANKPASALNEADPFYMVMPDLKPINGLVSAFGSMILSTERGRLHKLTGSSAKDFGLDDFYAGSAALGDEALAYIGNDVIYGRMGVIESLKDTEKFGESEADDLTRDIRDKIATYAGWTIAYNQRLSRVYLFPSSVSECWVYQKAFKGSELSPWSKWVTTHAMAFQPTFAASMLDPGDGLEYVFMGDSSGNIYRLEGVGTSGDGGSAAIDCIFKSKMFVLPLDAGMYDVEGWIAYRRRTSADVVITMETSGEKLEEVESVVALPSAVGGPYYNNSSYYSDSEYYGTARFNRIARQRFNLAGGSNQFQIQVRYDGTADIRIAEVGLRFRASGD